MCRSFKCATFTYLATLLVHLVDRLDSIQVVNTGVEANLVHNNDPCLLGFLVEGAHGWGDVRGRNNVRLALDGSLNDCRVVGERYKGDDEVVGSDLFLKIRGGNVKRDPSGPGKSGGQGLSGSKSATSYIV